MGRGPIDHLCVVGLGSIGRRHVRLARKLFPSMRISAVRSGVGGTPPEVALLDEQFSTVEVACEHVDAAIIASPAHVHADQACAFLQNDVHVLIEKPVATELSGLENIERAFDDRHLVCQLGYVLRHHPAPQYVKECIEKKIIGEVAHLRVECSSYLPSWRPGTDFRQSVSARPETGGGVLYELSHELDYLSWLVGPAVAVQANLSHISLLGIEGLEAAQLLTVHDKGVMASTHLDFNSRMTSRRCAVTGSRGTILWDGVLQTVSCKSDIGDFTKNFVQDADKMYCDQLLNFMASCVGEQKPLVTLQDGRVALELINAANTNAQKASSVKA